MTIRKPWLTGIRAVAIVEAAKAALVLLAGLGLLALVHRDVQAIAERFIRHSHLNPASKYPRIFIDAADKLTDSRLWLLAGFAALYAAVRGIEAFGLWRERRWAEWFALASGGIYLPVEIYEVLHRVTWIKVSVLLINAAVVAYMALALKNSAAQDRELARNGAPGP
jgi:uncharacterized membrane protein (DUF2068 family)